MNIETLFKKAQERIDDHIEMLYISALSKGRKSNKDIDKSLNNTLIEKYLKRRGYIENVVLGNVIFTKGFVCVKIHTVKNETDHIEIWCDILNKGKSQYIHQSLLTGLPVALNYFERIN
jgi:hypothetical protein